MSRKTISIFCKSPLIAEIAEKLKQYQAVNVVVDPVMVATSGAKLISDDAIAVLKESLLPLACVLTPHIPEAEVLSRRTIRTEEEMAAAGGSMGKKSTIPIPTEPAVRFPVQLRPTLRKDLIFILPWNGQKHISPVRWGRCWIWEKEAARWIMDLACQGNIWKKQQQFLWGI